ncbi:MAG: 4a-hydroxytetrahydrobiopterin dehydratase [Candidatus Korobacteraceae bacterium]
MVTEHHITRTVTFPDFRMALDFVNRVGEVAERQGHHPDILLAWGKAEVTLWTYKIDGLTESDFIMAAKIDGLYPG